ncbi:hypothetical protein BJ508DRAFT_300280 [Ascobolus immersus RN42]|uniref:Uncharacterized protein n=1 Tax=Ascobolus immersus RN42 TaxID=1160509 RepID=A0A3N4IQ48_ASCIM|nr:hypothetical protein BJ508DRAFT_300280 [Ascobolus immersus RN42]
MAVQCMKRRNSSASLAGTKRWEREFGSGGEDSRVCGKLFAQIVHAEEDGKDCECHSSRAIAFDRACWWILFTIIWSAWMFPDCEFGGGESKNSVWAEALPRRGREASIRLNTTDSHDALLCPFSVKVVSQVLHPCREGPENARLAVAAKKVKIPSRAAVRNAHPRDHGKERDCD